MKDLDKKDSSISTGYLDSLKKRTIDKSARDSRMAAIGNMAKAFAIPKDLLQEVKRDDLFNQKFVMGIDPAETTRDRTVYRQNYRSRDHELFINGIIDICKEAEYMHERISGDRLYSKIVCDDFPHEVAISFESRYIRDTFVCTDHGIRGYPYPHNITKIRDQILGKINDDLRRQTRPISERNRRPPGTCSDYPNCACGLSFKKKEPEKIKAPKELKSIVSNAIGEFNPDKIKLLGDKND